MTTGISSALGLIPIPVANGGTGAATLTGALVGNGTSAITAGTLSVANGGTGAVTLTGLLVGNGTSAVGVTTFTAAGVYSPVFSLATAGDSSWTYTGTPVGRFQRVGGIVYFQAQLIWSGFTNGTGSGNWQFNVPVAAGAFVLAGQIQITGTGVIAVPANSLPIYGSVASGASIGTIFTEGNSKIAVDNTGVAQVNTLVLANVGTAGTLNISGWYFAA